MGREKEEIACLAGMPTNPKVPKWGGSGTETFPFDVEKSLVAQLFSPLSCSIALGL